MRTRTGKRRAEEREPERKRVRVPHDTVNEQVLIAAVIRDESARRYLDTVPAASFFGEGHAEVWAALQEMRRRKLDYDPRTLRSIGGRGIDLQRIRNLVDECPDAPPNLRHHVDTLQWDRARIELAEGPMQELMDAMQDPRTDPARLRGLVRRMSDGLQGQGSQAHLRSGHDVVREQSLILTQRREHGVKSYGFGIRQLDFYEEGHTELGGRPRVLPGTAPGLLTVITGRSGSGKSTTTARMVKGLTDQGRKVLWGCWEQGSGMSLEILAAISLEVSRRDLIEGNYTAEEQRELETEMHRLAELITFYEFQQESSNGRRGMNERILDQIGQVVSDSGCDVFIADLFRRALHETGPDDEELALYRMQQLAKDTTSHFMLVQQQKTKGESVRRDMRPSGDNIKGSTEWFNVADNVIAWHRPGQWKEVPDDVIEGLVLKQRHGPWPLAVEFEWEGEYGHIGAGRSIPFPHDQNSETEINDDVDDFLRDGTSARKKRKKA